MPTGPEAERDRQAREREHKQAMLAIVAFNQVGEAIQKGDEAEAGNNEAPA